MMIRRIVPLAGIVVAAWLLILFESYLFLEVVIPLGPPIHSLGLLAEVTLLKLGLTLGLAVLWFVVIVSLTQLYIRTRLRDRTPSASS
jgi:hypothetical protein